MTEIRFTTSYQLGDRTYAPGEVATVDEPRAGQIIDEGRADPADAKPGTATPGRRNRAKRAVKPDGDDAEAD